jgi:2-polyprenyl-3-methyl-5-hydroxy-6-metoxy-1,4-benzoquinol methylase
VPSDAHSTTNARSVAAYFDDLYRRYERYWWRGEDRERYSDRPEDYPTSLLTQLTLRLIRGREPGRALDLGAGEGADSIRLAKMGYKVTAVDISDVAADKIRKFAGAEGADISVETADISDYHPEGQFDIVICNGVLHYIRDKESVLERIQAATGPGGVNVISSWTTFTEVPESHNSVPVYRDEEDGAIARAYRSWDIKLLYLEHGKPEESHEGMPAHSHSHVKLIAEKPGT